MPTGGVMLQRAIPNPHRVVGVGTNVVPMQFRPLLIPHESESIGVLEEYLWNTNKR
jgi:hypothetical protein